MHNEPTRNWYIHFEVVIPLRIASFANRCLSEHIFVSVCFESHKDFDQRFLNHGSNKRLVESKNKRCQNKRSLQKFRVQTNPHDWANLKKKNRIKTKAENKCRNTSSTHNCTHKFSARVWEKAKKSKKETSQTGGISNLKRQQQPCCVSKFPQQKNWHFWKPFSARVLASLWSLPGFLPLRLNFIFLPSPRAKHRANFSCCSIRLSLFLHTIRCNHAGCIVTMSAVTSLLAIPPVANHDWMAQETSCDNFSKNFAEPPFALVYRSLESAYWAESFHPNFSTVCC